MSHIHHWLQFCIYCQSARLNGISVLQPIYLLFKIEMIICEDCGGIHFRKIIEKTERINLKSSSQYV